MKHRLTQGHDVLSETVELNLVHHSTLSWASWMGPRSRTISLYGFTSAPRFPKVATSLHVSKL